MKKKVMMVLGAVGALAIGLFAVAAVGAQEVDSVTRPLDNLVSKVADKLGVSEDEFVGAWNDSQIELIDEAVANGDLDADEAQRIKDRIAESDGIFVPRPPDRPPHDRAPGQMLIVKAANAVLDLEEGELKAAFEEGQSLLDVALANGFTEDEFKAALLDEVQAQLDVLVDEGKIGQEMADEIYARISENIDEIVNHSKDDRPPGDRFPVHKLVFRAANTVLELEEGELAEALHSGQSLLDVALENGFTEEEFTAALLEQVDAQLQELVASGEIGEEAAAMIFERISENIGEIVNHTYDDRPDDRPRDGPRPRDDQRDHGPFGSDVPETDVATTDL